MSDETSQNQNTNSSPAKAQKVNTLSVIGLIMAFFIPIVGFICSIIGLNQTKKKNEKGRGLAIAGIVISVVVALLQILTLVAIVSSSSITLTSYKDNSAGYTVQYPKDWTISYSEDQGAKSVSFKDEDKKTGKSTGQVEAVYVPAPATGYSKDVLVAIADAIKKDNKNTNTVYESRTKKNGLDTLTLITTYDGESGKIKAKTTIILKKDNSVVTLSTQSPEQNWDKYQDSFDEIHNTFTP